MSTNRIIEKQAATIRYEAVAPVTNITWDPVNNTGRVVFEVWDMVYENDVYKEMVRNPSVPTIERDIVELMGRTVDLGVYGIVPVGMVSLILKKVFDELYNEQTDQIQPVDQEVRGRPARPRPPKNT